MANEDSAELLLDFYNAAVTAGAYDPVAKTFTLAATSLSVGGTTIASNGNTDVNGTLGVDGAATFDSTVTATGFVPSGGVYNIIGALSTVADAPAKAILEDIIDACAAAGIATDGTT